MPIAITTTLGKLVEIWVLGVQRYTASRYDMYLDTDATIRYAIRYFTTIIRKDHKKLIKNEIMLKNGRLALKESILI